MKLASKIQIGRSQDSYGRGRSITIGIEDPKSGQRWLDIEMDAGTFLEALVYGTHEIGGEVELREQCIEHLGMKRISTDQEVFVPDADLKRIGVDRYKDHDTWTDKLATLLETSYFNESHPGWRVRRYFGSRDDIRNAPGGIKVRAVLYAFVTEN